MQISKAFLTASLLSFLFWLVVIIWACQRFEPRTMVTVLFVTTYVGQAATALLNEIKKCRS